MPPSGRDARVRLHDQADQCAHQRTAERRDTDGWRRHALNADDAQCAPGEGGTGGGFRNLSGPPRARNARRLGGPAQSFGSGARSCGSEYPFRSRPCDTHDAIQGAAKPQTLAQDIAETLVAAMKPGAQADLQARAHALVAGASHQLPVAIAVAEDRPAALPPSSGELREPSQRFLCNIKPAVGPQSHSPEHVSCYKFRDRWIPVSLPPPTSSKRNWNPTFSTFP